jgi:hypothetical protein
LHWARFDRLPGNLKAIFTRKDWEDVTVEITKALAALQPLYGKDNVEIITTDGRRVRGTVRSMKTTQALTTPSVKMEIANGQIVKIPFPTIAEIKDHNIGS